MTTMVSSAMFCVRPSATVRKPNSWMLKKPKISSFGWVAMSPIPGATSGPIALSAVFVESAKVRKNEWDDKPGWQAYGLSNANKTSKYEGGSSIQIDFDRTFGKTGYLRYITTVFSFYGWITDIGQKNKISDYSEYRIAYDDWVEKGSDIKTKPRLPIHPIVRWENTIDIKATKYLTTTFNFQLYYNRAQNYDIQTQLLLSVGLTYTFKNK